MSEQFRPWTGTILVEGQPSKDGRLLPHMSVAWDPDPAIRYPLFKVGYLLTGQIERIWRESTPNGWAIRASGTIEGYDEGAILPVGAVLRDCDWDESSLDPLVLRKGWIVAVTVNIDPAWPKTMLTVRAKP